MKAAETRPNRRANRASALVARKAVRSQRPSDRVRVGEADRRAGEAPPHQGAPRPWVEDPDLLIWFG